MAPFDKLMLSNFSIITEKGENTKFSFGPNHFTGAMHFQTTDEVRGFRNDCTTGFLTTTIRRMLIVGMSPTEPRNYGNRDIPSVP